jgi:hypothetical protein
VLTAIEAGQANQRIPDHVVLEFATRLGRAVLTLNRWEFIGLHTRNPGHPGIVACTLDPGVERQAAAIALESIAGVERGETVRADDLLARLRR